MTRLTQLDPPNLELVAADELAEGGGQEEEEGRRQDRVLCLPRLPRRADGELMLADFLSKCCLFLLFFMFILFVFLLYIVPSQTTLHNCEPHFVRCLVPNTHKKPGEVQFFVIQIHPHPSHFFNCLIQCNDLEG